MSTALLLADRAFAEIANAEGNVVAARANASLDPEDVPLLYEGLLLRLHTTFEQFLRSAFFEIVSMPGPVYNAESTLLGLSASRAEAVVYAEGDRLDWIPFEKTAGRADIYLTANNPFNRLLYRDRTLQLLQFMHVTRNRVGHPSEEAERKYLALVVQKDRSHAVPGRWLADSTLDPRNSNLNVLLATCRAAAEAIALPAPDLDQLLSPAAAVTAERNAYPGKYSCTGAGEHVVTIGERQKLGTCRSCAADTWRHRPW